ncbi:hypothetical protein NADFUDRAFT_67259 [Nadsonia fulvescens var. elongata DSM 6958]|uniref:Uncharacterized protein n=1 Tax=Nadsonia fulvescens var. elongata DSM 6958 TaxID=857566 RepID=A0A1E3PF97_9ASCO|nr:hypothetical protein NADFUDRAFT_67259 [Nadsonia fulvescens var. elongata DSM 6958]
MAEPNLFAKLPYELTIKILEYVLDDSPFNADRYLYQASASCKELHNFMASPENDTRIYKKLAKRLNCLLLPTEIDFESYNGLGVPDGGARWPETHTPGGGTPQSTASPAPTRASWRQTYLNYGQSMANGSIRAQSPGLREINKSSVRPIVNEIRAGNALITGFYSTMLWELKSKDRFFLRGLGKGDIYLIANSKPPVYMDLYTGTCRVLGTASFYLRPKQDIVWSHKVDEFLVAKYAGNHFTMTRFNDGIPCSWVVSLGDNASFTDSTIANVAVFKFDIIFSLVDNNQHVRVFKASPESSAQMVNQASHLTNTCITQEINFYEPLSNILATNIDKIVCNRIHIDEAYIYITSTVNMESCILIFSKDTLEPKYSKNLLKWEKEGSTCSARKEKQNFSVLISGSNIYQIKSASMRHCSTEGSGLFLYGWRNFKSMEPCDEKSKPIRQLFAMKQDRIFLDQRQWFFCDYNIGNRYALFSRKEGTGLGVVDFNLNLSTDYNIIDVLRGSGKSLPNFSSMVFCYAVDTNGNLNIISDAHVYDQVSQSGIEAENHDLSIFFTK